jgi:ubiquinone biosynthesis protein
MATPLQRAYENVRAGEAIVRDANRFRQILVVLVRHGFGALVERLQLDERWLVKKLLERGAAEAERLPLERRVVLAIHDLGSTFVKLGQILSTRPDLLPPALVAELETLQDAVPPLPFDEVRAVLRAELGRELEDVYDDFRPAPLASASIAQVHRARLKGSDVEVAVKVQRPQVRRQIEADLEILGFLARTLEKNFPEAQLYSPAGVVAQFEQAIRREIDFTNELANIERLRHNFRDAPRVHFPTPYPELCTVRVLTMEFVAGTKITLAGATGLPLEQIARTGLDAVLQMVLADGFFHGDLHPGNLLVRDDGVLCFLDLGLCGRLTARQRDQLVDVLAPVARQDFAAVARAFWRIGIHGKESTRDFDAFEGDVVECLERRFAAKLLDEIDLGAFVADLIGLATKHRIRMPPDYAMTFKAVVTMQGVAKQLLPDLDVFAALRPYVATLIAERYSPRRLAQSAYDLLRNVSESVETLPETSRAILDDLRAGRTRLSIELNRLDELQARYAAVQHRNMVAMLCAASAVCGTLALDDHAYTVLGFPGVSFSFYAATALLGGWYLALRPRRRP